MSIFNEIVKIAKKKNDYAFKLNEDNLYEIKTCTDTGCYILNAVLSKGDIFQGLPDGKRIMISGQPSTAKSLFTTFIIGSYMRKRKNAYAVFFETEGSTVVDMAESIGIPEDRMIVLPVSTVEECRTQMINLIDKIIDMKEGYETKVNSKGEKVRKKIKDYKCKYDDEFIFCIDSIGMLGTLKETNDVAAGKTTKDLTRAQLLKSFARIISLKLSIAKIPLIIVNHTYSTYDKYNPYTASGGSGPTFMADVHLMCFKSKEKEDKKQIGVKIRIHVDKSRFIIEKINVNVILHFKRGLYKYSSLIDLADEFGVFKKKGHSFIFPDGTKHKMKDVRSKPSKYLNDETLKSIRDAIKDEFSFGKLDPTINIEDELDEIDEDIKNNIEDDKELH